MLIGVMSPFFCFVSFRFIKMSLYNQNFKKTGWENKDRNLKFNMTVLSLAAWVHRELMIQKMPKNEPHLQDAAAKSQFI